MFCSCDERFYIYVEEKAITFHERESLLRLNYGVNNAMPTTTSKILCKAFL